MVDRPSAITISIHNCNNIMGGQIEIVPQKLNIKYAINGTGKTTISHAIRYSCIGENLNLLRPFKFCSEPSDETAPLVEMEGIKNVETFDEEYVADFLFKPNELIDNSFEIFIKNDKYNDYEDGISRILSGVKLVASNEELDVVFNTLTQFSNGINQNRDGSISKNSTIKKACKNGNNIANIPDGLKEYSYFIDKEGRVGWLRWQHGGIIHLDESHKCPFCTSNVADKVESINLLNETYDPKVVESLDGLIHTFEIIKDYLSPETQSAMHAILYSSTSLSSENDAYIVEVKKESDRLLELKHNLQNMSYGSLKDVGEIPAYIDNCMLDTNQLKHFKSAPMEIWARQFNDCLIKLKNDAGVLMGNINKQRDIIKGTIREYSNEMNDFLTSAGFDYRVCFVEGKDEEYHLLLNHKDLGSPIDNPRNHLSYGEKNAFALILFMYGASKKNPDLIILDDPISSFDRNKRFAILNMLFMNKNSKFKNKTVLLLTHDFSSISDAIRIGMFNPCCSFLSTINGNLLEIPIEKGDLKTFKEICIGNAKDASNIFSRMVFLRRYFEIEKPMCLEWDYLSSVLHKHEPRHTDSSGPLFSESERAEAESIIKDYVGDYDLDDILSEINDTDRMLSLYDTTESSYEKIQLYRMIRGDNSKDGIVRNFINSVFHPENDMIYQLDPSKYQTVPQYILDVCTKDLNELRVVNE